MRNHLLILECITLITLLPIHPAIATPQFSNINNKITFDISTLSEAGLLPSDTTIEYEFCIPATPAHLAEIKTIDPSVQYFPHSPGRIGCRRDQYLCISSTHQPNWQETLFEIASLDYIQRIDRFWGE
jgi:hypothetical protein